MTFLPSVWSASVCFTACNSSPSIRSKALHHVPGTTGTDALTTGAADLFRNPPGKFAHIRIKDPAASNGVFDPRGSRQISMQAWLLGSLLAGIKKDRIVPAHPPSQRRRRAGTIRSFFIPSLQPVFPQSR